MTTVLCGYRVADYDIFRPGYDRAVQLTPGSAPSGSGADRTIRISS